MPLLMSLGSDSDSDIEICEPRRPALDPTPAPPAPRAGSSKSASPVVILSSDDEGDDLLASQYPPPRSMTRTVSAPTPGPSSDDLPEFRRTASASIHSTVYASTSRSKLPQAGPSGLLSTSTNIIVPRKPSALLAAMDALDTSKYTAQAKGKSKALAIDVDMGESGSESEDPYDTMRKKGKQTTYKKRPVPSGARAGMSSDDDDAARVYKPKKKAPRLSEEDKEARKQAAAQEKERKNSAKAADAEAKKRLVRANKVTRERTEILSELTLHVAGRAFRPPPPPVDNDVGTSVGKGKGKKKEEPPSPWLAIVEGIRGTAEDNGSALERDGEEYDLGVEGTLRWTRACDKKWSEEKKQFEPLASGSELIVEEDTRVVFISALEISAHIADKTLLTHIQKVKSRLPSHVNLFLMVYGLKKLFTSLANAKEAAYRARVREEESFRPKFVGIGERQPSKDELESQLMRMQVATKCFIIQVDTEEEAIEWLDQMTFDVGDKPYQRQKRMHVAELGCGDEKIVSGKDLFDTYRKMLTCIRMVTEPVAKAIAAEYPTLRDLYEGWAECPTEEDKKKMLVGIQKMNNLNGAATNRSVGAKMSEQIYRVFVTRDPTTFL